MKKGLKVGAASLAALLVFGVAGCGKISDADGKAWAEKNGYVKENVKKLPGSVNYDKDGCDADPYSAACGNINAENLINYMNLDNVDYIDTRGGVASDKPGLYSEGHLKGFRNVEWFEYVWDGSTGHTGKQLFYTDNGVFVPRYVDSVETLKALFPQDKVLFIMCESGGRVANVMKLLAQYGWDMEKVYNVGGWMHYTTADARAVYGDYILETTDYTVKTATTSGTVYGQPAEVTVNVLVDADGVVGKVYIAGGTYATSEHKAEVDAGLEALFNSFVGKDLEEIQAAADNYTTGGADVITGATDSTQLIYNAVVDALEA